MAFATMSGPVRMGTVKENSGRNTGLPVLTQSATVAASAMTTSPTAQALFVLPAGAKILRFNVEKLATIANGGVTGVNATFGTAATADAYMTSAAIGLTTAQAVRATLDAALVSSATNNIGTSDVTVFGTFTATGGNPTAGSAVVTIEYIQRGSDGAQFPATA